jgi:LDH2 family malate/lactate/ureidoglycolate dehydrogenase
MLLHYHRALLAGTVTMTPTIAVVRETATTALVDGGGGLGHVSGDTAMKLAVAKCRDTGVAAVAVRNSGHYGAAGAYARMAVASGFLGVATTSTWSPTIVPTFGAEAKLGTNPIAFAAPTARNAPFVLDMATSTASIGKLTTAWRKGRRIPAGWALDPKGSPVTRARAATLHRRLTPLGSSPETGSYKGYGLAAMVEILSSTLSGHRPRQGGAQTDASAGHFFLAIDPDRFRDEGAFASDLDVLVDSLHACAPVDPSRPVLVPGDPEHAAFAERRRDGIPLSRNVVEDLRAVARRSGVPFTLDAA